MHTQPTVTAQAVIPTDATPVITDLAMETATIHPTGLSGGLSLHFATLDEAIAWHGRLGRALGKEFVRRNDARVAIDEMEETLHRVGAR